MTIVANGKALETADWGNDLYRNASPREATVSLTALPYYLWNNRTKGSMTVWIAEE